MGGFTANLKSMGAALGIAFAGAQVANFAKDAVMAASTMNESVSKVQVVFSDSSDAVLKWGKTAAEAMGLSNQKAIESAGTYGNLFQALGITKDKSQEMSTTMVQLASDLASFNNTSVDDALNALRSGLSGETEPLKRFGVALNDVTLKNKAMSMGLITNTSGVLPPAIKAQTTYALLMEQTTLAQGDYARTSKGTANTIKTLQAKFADASVAVGNMLLPALNLLLAVAKPIVSALQAVAGFVNDNKEAFTAFAAVIAIGTVGWGAYVLVTKAAIIQQKIFNLVSKLNPIGLIITAVALLAAGFTYLWNKSETFRKIIIAVGQIGVKAIAFIIFSVGKLVTGIMQLVTGPMRLLLKGLDFIGVSGAGEALKEINGAIESVGNFFDDATKKVLKFGDSLTKYAKIAPKKDKAAIAARPDKVVEPVVSAAAQKAAQKVKEELAKLKTDALDTYASMNKEIANANQDSLNALTENRAKSREAYANYDETVLDLTNRFNEDMLSNQASYEEALLNANEASEKAKKTAKKRFADSEISIIKDYNKKKADLEESYQAKIADIRQKASDQSNELVKSSAEKQSSILQQSMDRLRSAFASKLSFNLADSFDLTAFTTSLSTKTAEGWTTVFSSAAKTGTDKLLANLKEKLQGAKDLQANAAKLAGMGYSQVFIEEVVKNGPEAGNKIAAALQAASPEATRELQDLYGQVETISNHGLDALASSMNAGGKLATEELMTAYDQVSVDLKKSLANVNTELTSALAEADKVFQAAMVDNKLARDTKLDEAMVTLQESLTETQSTLDNALADAKKSFDKANETTTKSLEKGMADAHTALTKALATAQEDYDAAISKIQTSTFEKLAALQKELEKTAEGISKLGDKSSFSIVAKAPVYNPSPTVLPMGGNNSGGSSNAPIINNYNVDVSSQTNATPDSIAKSTLNALKFNMPIYAGANRTAGL
jgi:hypothetical protein